MEYGWAYLKGHVLANHAPVDERELLRSTKVGMCRTRRSKRLLAAFIDHSPLSFFD
jgi:hypothetical protein